MAKSPLLDADGPVCVVVTSDGNDTSQSAALISVTVRSAVNQVPRATLVFADGDMAGQTFPLSDSAHFRPGAEVKIKVGYGTAQAQVFGGIVVRHGLRISGDTGARLIVECHDKALKMTVGRKNAQHVDKTESDVISLLIGNHGLTANVSGTAFTNAELIQHNSTDWDFMLARAEANGCLVVVEDGSVNVSPPDTAGPAALKVGYGHDLIEFHADLVASQQQLKSGLARLRGQMRFQGSALARVGKIIDVEGVGERFNGAVFVTGVTHEIKDGIWTTEVEFGAPAAWLTERSDVMAPAAAGLVPGIEGLHAGVVLKLEGDPAGEHRVQVQVPSAGVASVWARLLQFHASSGFGAFFAPEVGDEVLLGWFGNDPGFPVVLGSLYSSKHAPPTPQSARNDIKAIVTRCKARLEFNDEDKVITLLTPGNNKMVFSDKDKSIFITDQNNNRVELGPDGITLDSPENINIRAKGAITVDAVGPISMGSKEDVKVEGLNVSCSAQVGMVVKGAASAELSASGQTTVKGALVMIN